MKTSKMAEFLIVLLSYNSLIVSFEFKSSLSLAGRALFVDSLLCFCYVSFFSLFEFHWIRGFVNDLGKRRSLKTHRSG